jgi:hypothetical protein
MRWRHASAADGARTIRLAWLASFLATLALVGILAMARSAQALTVPEHSSAAAHAATASPFDLDSEEGAEEEFEAEECEEAEGEGEEGCEEGGGPEAPSECILDSAQATVFASTAQDRIRLAVRYAAVSPTVVAIDYGLHGDKGSLYLGQSRKYFSKTGVFRQTESLSEPEMEKAASAKDFTVQLYAVNAPRYCRHYLDQYLTARHAAAGGLIWTDPEVSFRR